MGRRTYAAGGVKRCDADGKLEFGVDCTGNSGYHALISGQSFEYPALYRSASDASAGAQRSYLNLLRCEYGFLLVAAVFSMDFSEKPLYYVLYTLVFLGALMALLYRSTTKPEQGWYKGRALAESIKTSTWRYCMRSAPFQDNEDVKVPRGEFRNHLKSVLESNRHVAEKMPPGEAARDQITDSMEKTRALSLEDRKQFYDTFRVRDQRKWYQSKAGANKRSGVKWVIICIIVYVFAIVSVLLRTVFPEWTIWPTEPLIVAASSIVGWIQIKRFNELATSYALTAHEIGIIQDMIAEIKSEHEFSEFINEAELAFSREHTQWVARQQYI